MIELNNYSLKRIFTATGIVIFIAMFFAEPSVMSGGVSKALTICASTVIPSLFPFIVLSDFIIRSGLCVSVGRKLKKPARLIFGLSGNAVCVIIMSLFGGFPVGAKMTAQLIDSGSISKNEGRRMMLFCVNGGPAFIVGAVGSAMLSSRKAGIILYASLVITALLTGALSKIFAEKAPPETQESQIIPESGALISSVSQGTAVMLNICAWIIVFSCVSGYFSLLPVSKSTLMWINMLSEVTQGCIWAAGNFPACIMALIIGWSGLAVHCQIYPYIRKTGLSILHFWLSRLINGGVATALAWVLFKLFPCEVSVFSNGVSILPQAYSVSAPAAAAMLIMGGFAILDIDLARMKKV